MAIIQGSAKSSARGFYPLDIEQSLRFNDNDSAYLSRTPASAGNRKTWTWSGWVKRSALGSLQDLMTVYNGSADTTAGGINFNSTDNLRVVGWFTTWRATTQVFRDVSAWYHIVVAMDTTQATANNRVRVYLNGLEITAFGTLNNPSQNSDLGINQASEHNIGRDDYDGTRYFDGYLAEVHFIDGTAYDADAFGEFKSGVWVAKTPSVTYGTNGFYLDFANSADIGNDVSGEGNDWTPNNFTASDVVLDSPTDNFCTWNPLQAVAVNAGAGIGAFNLSDGNLVSAEANSTNTTGYVCGTMAVSSGKWYWEVDCTSIGGTFGEIGIHRTSAAIVYSGSTDNDYRYRNDGTKQNGGTGSAYGASLSTGDVVGVALDLEAGTLTFYKNNVSQGIAFSGISGEFTPSVGDIQNSTANTYTANFGQLGFTYTPPTGYLALSTANLPDPVIDPAQDASPSDYFNTVLYTGNGSTQSITGVGFQPDFLWTKCRSASGTHALYDVIRVPPNVLYSNATNAEESNAAYVNQFDADGFTTGSANLSNQSGESFVAWNWKANGSGVSNTDGTITSTVSANTTSGFSIVSFVNAASTNQETVGHGLTQAPDLIIAKNRDTSANNWAVFHSSVCDTTSKFLKLNTTDAVATFSTVWGAALPTSSVFGVTGTGVAASSVNVIAYCFHSVEGFSKFGSYTGNGSADGPFVFCGFRPAWIMIKRTDTSGLNWNIFDTSRSELNPVGDYIAANTSAAEGTIASTDNLSNGFKVRSNGSYINASGGTYIFMAFADDGGPFKFSNAR